MSEAPAKKRITRTRGRNIRRSPEYLRAYKAWNNMIHRTTNENHPNYPRYGGRGVTVDPRWLEWDNYFADMGPMGEGMSLERRDVNGPYAPSNCCYIPRAEQAKNRRNSIRLEYDGRTLILADWARELDIPSTALYGCIVKQGLSLAQVVELGLAYEASIATNRATFYARIGTGWSPEDAATLGKHVTRKTALEINGDTASVSEWCRRLCVSRNAYEVAIRRGERPIDALKRLATKEQSSSLSADLSKYDLVKQEASS